MKKMFFFMAKEAHCKSLEWLFVSITIDDFCVFVSNATRKGFWGV